MGLLARLGLRAQPAQVTVSDKVPVSRIVARAARVKAALERDMPPQKRRALKLELAALRKRLEVDQDALQEVLDD